MNTSQTGQPIIGMAQKEKLYRKKKFLIVIALIGSLVGIVSFASRSQAYVWTQLSTGANSTNLSGCRSTVNGLPIVRLKYSTGSGVYRSLMTSFGNSTVIKNKTLTTGRNWTWSGSYTIPAGATSLKTSLQNSITSSYQPIMQERLLALIISCDATTPPPVQTGLTPGAYNDTEQGIVYSEGWQTATGSEKYNGDDHYSSTANSNVKITFTGTQVEIFGTLDAHHGIAGYTVDGGAEANVSYYGASRVDQALVYKSGILSSGTHTLTIRVTGQPGAGGGSVVTLDKIVIGNAATPPIPSSALRPGTYNDTSTQLAYSANWSTSTGAGKYNSDDHYSSTADASLSFTFDGPQVEIYGAVDAHHGIAAVSVDGGAEVTVDQYSATRLDNALLFRSNSSLASGAHTIRLRVTGTKNSASSSTVIAVDRIVVNATAIQWPIAIVTCQPGTIGTPPNCVAPPPASSGFITRSGTKLYYNSQEYKFSGLNSYRLATYWPVNYGCNSQYSDADMAALFQRIGKGGLVRFWAFQDFVINKNTQARDWTPLDRVFNAAQQYNVKLIPVFADHWANCEPGKNVAWYGGGYNQPQTQDWGGVGSSRVSYWDFVGEVVNRYKGSSAVGFWDLINEPEGAWDAANNRCIGQTELRNFFTTMTNRVKSLDPNHLVSAGVIGSNQCGLAGNDWLTVFDGTPVDILGINNYNNDWDSLYGPSAAARVPQANQMNKPLYIKEAAAGYGTGATSDSNIPCKWTNRTDRSAAIKSKIDANFAQGVVGFVWWQQFQFASCESDVFLDDPLFGVLMGYPLP